MKSAELKLSALLSVDPDLLDDELVKKIREVLFREISLIVGVSVKWTQCKARRRKPDYIESARQWKFAIAGGWVNVEPEITVQDAVQRYVENGATYHIRTNSLEIIRIKRGKYRAIGEHEGRIVSVRVLGKLVLSRQKPRASDSR